MRTTNNRMEMLAAIRALEAVRGEGRSRSAVNVTARYVGIDRRELHRAVRVLDRRRPVEEDAQAMW